MRKRQTIEHEMNKQLQNIVNAARLVTIFDGTDRDSLDQLREALYRFGALQVEYHEREG